MGPVFDGKSTITSDDLVDRILAFLLLFDAQQMRYAGSSLTNVLNRAITASIFPVRQRLSVVVGIYIC